MLILPRTAEIIATCKRSADTTPLTHVQNANVQQMVASNHPGHFEPRMIEQKFMRL
jgi:hypothetical protein